MPQGTPGPPVADEDESEAEAVARPSHTSGEYQSVLDKMERQAIDLGSKNDLIEGYEKTINNLNNRIQGLEGDLLEAKEKSDKAWHRRNQAQAALQKQVDRVNELARTETLLSTVIAELRAELAEAMKALT